MEVVREIISISHDGFDRMWSPLYIENKLNSRFINFSNIGQSLDLVRLVHSMFSTNNHNYQKNSDFLIDRMESTSTSNISQCTIEFKTEKSEYVLSRVLINNYSIEIRLVSKGSKTILFGENAIQRLRKITCPITVLEAKSYSSRSQIFKPDSEHSRISMLEMTKRWSMMLDFSMDLTYNLSPIGEWTFFYDSRRMYSHNIDLSTPSIVCLLCSLSQAAVRTRKYGYCPAIVCSVNVEGLNQFEMMKFIELVSNICFEERLNVLIATSYRGMIDEQLMINTSTM